MFADTLDIIKFICKDIWAACWDKQIDNLRTNHRVGVLSNHPSADCHEHEYRVYMSCKITRSSQSPVFHRGTQEQRQLEERAWSVFFLALSNIQLILRGSTPLCLPVSFEAFFPEWGWQALWHPKLHPCRNVSPFVFGLFSLLGCYHDFKVHSRSSCQKVHSCPFVIYLGWGTLQSTRAFFAAGQRIN